jgi:serine protease Do
VFFHDGQSLPATVVSADPRGDLAVLKVERAGLTPARIVDWPEVKRGQWTITLGNPYGLGGDGKLSVAVGFISNLGRRLPGLGEVDDRFYADMIQTTADIHAGCSGGPLFNVHGELIGVVTAMHTRAPADEGVGFAIPMTPNRCRSVRTLCEGRQITYGYIGLEVRPMQPEERQAAGLSPRIGAIVRTVEPGGPAGDAGLREGDLILGFDGQEVRGPGAFAELVGQTTPGRTVPVELQRGQERLVVQTEVQRREISRVAWMRGGAVLWRGLRVTDATTQVRRRMGVAAESVGVVVIDVAQDSPAERAALQIGDVIERVAETPIQSIAGFQASVRGKKGPLKIRVRSRGELLVQP